MIMKKIISGLLGFIGGSILTFSIIFGKVWIGIIAIILLFIISKIIYKKDDKKVLKNFLKFCIIEI